MNESIDGVRVLRPRRSVLSDISNRNQTNEIKGIIIYLIILLIFILY